MLATEQIAVAKALIERIDTALSWVLEAGNTSIMSDAKEIVYELLQDVSDDTILPEALRAKLKESLDQARSFIVSGDSPSSRALNCYAKLTDVQRRLLHFVYAAKHPDEPEQEIFMSNLRHWVPRTAPRELQAVLAVMTSKSLEMTQERHRMLLESKLAALARAVEPEEQDLLAELLR
ncbi:MAG: hypothetical protein IT466_04940 [Moraxellaceae bacterium]|nr:hypothetical protein [Moraxellaceae bacterium]